MASVSKSPDRIAGMFDAIAGRYDFLNHLLSAGIDRRWRRRAVGSLRLTGRERVLDVCTGTGDLAIAAMRARPSAGCVVGVDFAGAMLRVARAKIERTPLRSHVALVLGDAACLPIASASVDAVTIAFGIRNVEYAEAACAEMCRVLKQGGRLAMLEFAVPTAPIWRHCYGWYLRHVLPAVGRIVSQHPGAYGYLPASIDAFARPDELVKILRHVGFIDVSAVRLTFGSVYLYIARRGADILVTS
jgi:demethylmenaquinone methyltransferase/2-methoxy-6-polyprenyl-1,4-benzoquinol methylase